ncbi:MAG: hypothetical protein C0459_03120 [Chitinophaga sp.]|jgi:signal transduction histidine kinase|nr:hypothetical protein [Chitinophaga sp.]
MEEKDSYIVYTVIVASCIFFIVALFIFFYIRLFIERKKRFAEEKINMQQAFSQMLLQSQIETQEETIAQLGKELHDNVGQLLSSTKMLLGITERAIDNPPETLLTAEETISKAINELRNLSKSLSKEWLQQFDLIENLQAEIIRLNSSKIINIHFSHPEKLVIDKDRQMILFRILQESIQNTLKHADAKNIFIDFLFTKNSLQIVFKDDGKGFDTAAKANGIGIMNIKHRIKLLNGSIEWLSSSTNGTIINIGLPLNKPSNEEGNHRIS